MVGEVRGMSRKIQIRIAAVIMFIGIGLGAMGAHALEGTLEQTGHLDHWKTASLYLMIHGVAMFAVAMRPGSGGSFAYGCWLVGTILFSGSLYVLSYTGISKLGMITPFGGISFMVGWAALLFKPLVGSDGSGE